MVDNAILLPDRENERAIIGTEGFNDCFLLVKKKPGAALYTLRK
jgi:hypothetical protein